MLPWKAAVDTAFAQSANAVEGKARTAAVATAPSRVLERVWSLGMRLRVAQDPPAATTAHGTLTGSLRKPQVAPTGGHETFTALCCAG